ncbi:MAG: hypothetical protein JKX75_04955 [Gammaproteobacteria bacterium]|nr:hypothetical protein [Gammaproteobacteria bacterium]
MNNNISKPFILIICCAMFISGCSEDNSSFETPAPEEDVNTTLATNAGVISQDNFSILSEDLTPAIFANPPPADSFTFTELNISVRIGDRNNQVLTDAHTVFFKTEWGLIQPSCVTVDGTCSVVWQATGGNIPADHLNTIMAYTVGEESFVDTNGDGIFNDTIFSDQEEPYVDANRNQVFDLGDLITDVINGNDTTGINGVHDIGDTFFNGQGCTGALCSVAHKSIFVWDDVELIMDGPPP